MSNASDRSTVHRRTVLATGLAALVCPRPALAARAREITWDDLIPPGVPYSEIVGEGYLDEENDVWLPQYDSNARKLNQKLDGAYIRLPGYIIPVDFAASGVTSFILVPYVGACIHTPPPPANQLVFVTTEKPWPSNELWDPVWVTGHMSTQLQSTDLAETGYAVAAEMIEIYQW